MSGGDLVVEARELRKHYGQGRGIRAALDGVSLEVEQGQFLAVIGPSGCGKSTLLGILGGLDRAFQGELCLFGTSTRALSDSALARLRGGRIGFVFQAFHLLGHLCARDNVLAPTLFTGRGRSAAERRALRDRADSLLADLGLDGRGGDMPSQLSGGERQRVAIARAMLLEPELLLCDEPTGNLDAQTGRQIVDLFERLHGAGGLTVIGVTHDELLTRVATRIVRLSQGRMLDDARPEDLAKPPIGESSDPPSSREETRTPEADEPAAPSRSTAASAEPSAEAATGEAT